MMRIFLLLIFVLFTPAIIQCDLTNLEEVLNELKSNPSKNYPIGFLSKANFDVVKRYLRGNIVTQFYENKDTMLKALDNETIIGMLSINNLNYYIR
jgi:hypothetical protein